MSQPSGQGTADPSASQPASPGSDTSVPAPPQRPRRARLTIVLTVAFVVVVAAVAVGLSALSGSPASSSSRPGWALPWPDHRNGSVSRKVLDGAFIAWRHEAVTSLSEPLARSARASAAWYVGQTTAAGEVVVVMFEVDSTSGPRLVAGWASASEVMKGQPGWARNSTPWVLYDVAAPAPTTGLAIGLNVHGATAAAGQSPDNWIVVLAAPDVQAISWKAPGKPATSSGKAANSAHGATSHGLLIADTGQVTGRVKLTALQAGRSNTLEAPDYVGVPGNPASLVPELALPAPLRLPHGFKLISQAYGQGDVGTGISHAHGRARVTLTYTLGSKLTHLGAIRCNNAVHELITKVTLNPADSGDVTVYASDLTSFRFATGLVR
jgi:hypothetical protein